MMIVIPRKKSNFNPFNFKNGKSKKKSTMPRRHLVCGPFLAGGGRCSDLLL